MTVHVNSFAKRHTEDSRFSYYDGTFEQLASLVATHLDPASQRGYAYGMLEVPVPAENFFSGIVELKEGDKLVGSFEARRSGEEPRKTIEVVGSKLPAKSVKIILYSSSLLAKHGDNELPPAPGNWEVISINASTCEDGNEPINPQALMYNYFGMSGGTDPNLTVEEFVAALRVSVEYWKDKAMCAGS